MMDNRRYHVVKTKLNDKEYKIFQGLLDKSGARNTAEFLRSKIFLSDRQIAKREKMVERYGQELLEGQMSVLADMFSVINQYKAGVEMELAVEKLEEDVKQLWQLLKL